MKIKIIECDLNNIEGILCEKNNTLIENIIENL